MAYELAFDEEFEEQLRKNEKTITVRYGLEYIPDEGEVMDAYCGPYEFTVRFDSVEPTHIEQLPLYSFHGAHKEYESVEDAIEHIQQYYHDELTAESKVYILHFSIIDER
jgi:hypothetical protein